MWLVSIAGAGAVWAGTCLTARYPSERPHTDRGHTQHKLTERARRIIRGRIRGVPECRLVLVGERSVAVLEQLPAVRQTPHARVMPRWRLDAEWWNPGSA
jgi:hypothetical protein